MTNQFGKREHTSRVESAGVDAPSGEPEKPRRLGRLALLERAADTLAANLSTEEARRVWCRRLLRRTRFFLLAVSALYLLPLAALAAGIHWWSEKNLTLAFLSYLPPQIWLLPAPVFILVTLPFSFRLAALHTAAAAAFVFLYMDYQGAGTPPPPPAEDHLIVVSYNRGQSNQQSLQPFKNAIQPDILALQESFGRARLYERAETYSEFPHVNGVGEFVLLSKYPILNSRLISGTAWGRESHVAGRFEIDYRGTPIAVYNVHLRSVRDVLGYYKRGAFLYGIAGIPGTSLAERRRENQSYWDDRIALAARLAEEIENDPLPTLVVGDFNMPDHGTIYHLFANRFSDAHEESGAGFGYTFPGHTRNPLSLYSPWLRLDYAFRDENWQTLGFATEKNRASQHRAVAAAFALGESPDPPGAKTRLQNPPPR